MSNKPTAKIDLVKFQDRTQWTWITYAFVLTGGSASVLFGAPIIEWYEYVGYVGLIVSSFALIALASYPLLDKQKTFEMPDFDKDTGHSSVYYSVIGFFHWMNLIITSVLLFFSLFTVNFLLIAGILFLFGLHFRNVTAWFGSPENMEIYKKLNLYIQKDKLVKREKTNGEDSNG